MTHAVRERNYSRTKRERERGKERKREREKERERKRERGYIHFSWNGALKNARREATGCSLLHFLIFWVSDLVLKL